MARALATIMVFSWCIGQASTLAYGQIDSDLTNRIEQLERRVERLENQLGNSATVLSDRPVPSPTAHPSTTEPGWTITIFSLSEKHANTSRHPPIQDMVDNRHLLATFYQAKPVLSFAAVRKAAGRGSQAAIVYPILVRRGARYQVRQAGWHEFTYVFSFPASGFRGYLGGYQCDLSIKMDGTTIIETSVRMPRGRRNREAIINASRRFSPGWHDITDLLLCRPDGTQAADATDSLDQIQWDTMIQFPGSSHAEQADPVLFTPAQ